MTAHQPPYEPDANRASCSLCAEPCAWVFLSDTSMWACEAHLPDVLARFDGEKVYVSDARPSLSTAQNGEPST